jgi:hypothetical protein
MFGNRFGEQIRSFRFPSRRGEVDAVIPSHLVRQLFELAIQILISLSAHRLESSPYMLLSPHHLDHTVRADQVVVGETRAKKLTEKS